MNALGVLLVTQFLTAFADNAILFVAIAMITKAQAAEWYKPALQASFLVAFVVLAPWVGPFSDRRSKALVLGVGNALKALGTLLMFAQVEPLIAYAVVGVGAAVYGPAKYGILPELVRHEKLVGANGMVEGSTIVAIVLGAVVGAWVADQTVNGALLLIIAAYLLSLAGSLLIPRRPPQAPDSDPPLAGFLQRMRGFFTTPRARFSMLGAAIFWAAAVVLRTMLLAWAPVVLLTASTSEIANLTVFIAIGIALGAFVVPWLVPIERLRRARLAAYVMGALIVLLGVSNDPLAAKGLLLAIGMAGGIFVVPINAALQEMGARTVGTGAAVALQNFFENLAMLVGTGLYTLALSRGPDPVLAMAVLGLMVIAATTLVAWHLPKENGAALPSSRQPG